MAIQNIASGISYMFPLKSPLLPKTSIKKSSKGLGNKASGNVFGLCSTRHYMFSCINHVLENGMSLFKTKTLPSSTTKVVPWKTF